ncbi:MAG TPA: c-type cytochrome [Acidimicrobiales bacterium]|nr:c-type cytochrome [Acidimicrobiales bacterium]
MKSRLLPVLLAVGAALALGACGYLGEEVAPYRPPAYYRPPPPAPDVRPGDAGAHLYRRDCAFCHGNRGEGTPRGPDIVTGTNGPALMDFMLRTGRMPIDRERAQTRASEPTYTEGEMSAIVAYVERELEPGGPAIPEVDPSRGHIAEGQQLYQQHCVACHATTGIGGAMLTQRGRGPIGGTAGIIIPDFAQSDAIEIAEAVRTGPGTMPVFGRDIVTDDGLDSLVSYTLYLKDPDDQGGAAIGHIGPVAEGAVGWALGLGVLVIFIRWVGTKAGEKP